MIIATKYLCFAEKQEFIACGSTPARDSREGGERSSCPRCQLCAGEQREGVRPGHRLPSGRAAPPPSEDRKTDLSLLA